MTDVFDKPYKAFESNPEFFAIVSNGPFAFRFGPYTGEEAGQIISRSLEEGVLVFITAVCGKEFDWELAKDFAPHEYPPIKDESDA